MKIKYTDGGFLKHDVIYDPNDKGNPWRYSNSGKYAPAPFFKDDELYKGAKTSYDYNKYGSNYDFGSKSDDSSYSYKNRYQYTKTDSEGNKTIEYTPAGKRRLAYEESVNNAKKKDNRIDPEAVADVSRWIRDDSKGYQDMAESLAKGAKASNNIIDMFNKPKKGARFNLSEMSDSELRAILDREQMERRYDEYFNPPQINKGWEVVKGVNDFALNSAQGFATVMSIINAFKG